MDPVDTGISFSPLFQQYEACVAAGLDLERWENGGYEAYFMANVIAWHEGHHLVKSHSEDAVARKVKSSRRK